MDVAAYENLVSTSPNWSFEKDPSSLNKERTSTQHIKADENRHGDVLIAHVALRILRRSPLNARLHEWVRSVSIRWRES